MSIDNLKTTLFKPVNISFLVCFRVFAGFLIAGEVTNQLFTEDFQAYHSVPFHFTYLIFPFQILLTVAQAYLLFGIVIISGIMVGLGFFYRISSIVFFLSHLLLFLIEKAEYVNHFYLYVIITFFLMILPAEKAFSLDSKRTGNSQKTVPTWIYYLLVFQISVVYSYAGIAKIHADWMEVKALKIWMGYLSNESILGSILSLEITPYLLGYGGMLFDLLIVPLLLWHKTKKIAFILACTFHLTNVLIFGLATFPWFSIMMTTLFFGPSWHARLPIFKKYLIDKIEVTQWTVPKLQWKHYFLISFVFVQLLVPFRHFIYPGDVNWTEEGHRFSWHMMLRTKSGNTRFVVRTSKDLFNEVPGNHIPLNVYYDMSGDPEMILEYAHFLGDYYASKGYKVVSVNAIASIALNGRVPQFLVDETVNLLEQKRSLSHYDWIVPLNSD